MSDISSVLTSQVTVSSTTPNQLGSGLRNAEAGVVVKALAGNGASNVYVGGASTVTVNNGYELAAGASQLFPVQNIDELWVITATGTPKVSYMVL
jgi:hypothetical protein